MSSSKMMVMLKRVILTWVVGLSFILTTCSCASGFAPPSLYLAPLAGVRVEEPTVLSFLSAKKKKKDDSSLELSSLMKTVLPGKKANPMESGIETALLLTDKKRQVEWKKDVKNQFPWVPGTVLDICMDSLADAFATVVPSQLKAALQPGGLEKVRPELEETIVDSLKSQSMMDNLPLSADDKNQLLKYLVSLTLDYALKDAQEMLKDPQEKLQTLELQKREIQKYMTFRRLTWYRVRYFPLQMAGLSALTLFTSYAMYQQYKSSAVIYAIMGACATLSSSILAIPDTCTNLVSSINGAIGNLFSSINAAIIKLYKLVGLTPPKGMRKRARLVRR